MIQQDRFRNRLLTLIAFFLTVAALRWSYPVSMPLVVTFFIIAAAWPLKRSLERVLPASLSSIGTVLLLFLVLASFVALFVLALAQAAQTVARNGEQYRALYDAYAAWGQDKGLPVLGGNGGYDHLVAIARTVFWRIYAVLGYVGLIAVLVVMGLPEVPALGRKFRGQLQAAEHRQLVDTVETIAEKCRQYVGMTVLTSLITGAASALWAFSLGLEFPLLWGVLNFLLNFIPVFGNVIGIIPPTLYAVMQFDGWVRPAIVFAGFAVLQIVISNVVYPMLQGHSMSMPPIAIIVSLLFWGWVWGVAGALLAVPLTATIVIVCGHFKATEWISHLLGRRN